MFKIEETKDGLSQRWTLINTITNDKVFSSLDIGRTRKEKERCIEKELMKGDYLLDKRYKCRRTSWVISSDNIFIQLEISTGPTSYIVKVNEEVNTINDKLYMEGINIDVALLYEITRNMNTPY